MKRTTGIIAALAAVGLTLTGCSATASQNRRTPAAGESAHGGCERKT